MSPDLLRADGDVNSGALRTPRVLPSVTRDGQEVSQGLGRTECDRPSRFQTDVSPGDKERDRPSRLQTGVTPGDKRRPDTRRMTGSTTACPEKRGREGSRWSS